MAIWIDIIGSFLIGTLLLINVMHLNTDLITRAHQGTLDGIVTRNVSAVQHTMADDLQKMGYGVSGTAILQAQTDRIQFLSDIEANGSIDTLDYYLSTTALASDTPNPADFYLYRTVNSATPQGMRFGITHFHLRYYSASGDSLSTPVATGEIRKIQATLMFESPMPYDTTYARTYVQFSVSPKNLGL